MRKMLQNDRFWEKHNPEQILSRKKFTSGNSPVTITRRFQMQMYFLKIGINHCDGILMIIATTYATASNVNEYLTDE